MQFIAAVLQQASAQGDISRKFGALVLVTALDTKLKRTEPYKAQLEAMVTSFVLPDLASPSPLLRAMAVWTFARYANINFANDAAYTAGLQRTLELTQDSNLAVSVFAALGLKHHVQVERGKELMRPLLGPIFDTFYRFIDRTDLDLDDLVIALEVFVDVYGAEIAPHAFGICKHLVEAFSAVAYAPADGSSGEVDDGQILKAAGCLETLSTILTAVHAVPDLFRTLGISLVPLISYVLSQSDEQCVDYLSDTLTLAQIITFWTPQPLPAEYWVLFPLIYKSFEDYAMDYIADMLSPLDNFISRGTETFLSNPAYIEMVYKMVHRYLGDPKSDEVDSLKACQLAEVVMHFCRGRVDAFVTAIVDLAAQRLASAKIVVLRVLLIELVANGIYYNPLLALQALEAKSQTSAVFAAWYNTRDEFARPYDKKIAVLALTSLFRVPAQLPQLI
jgi:hypothetical protein